MKCNSAQHNHDRVSELTKELVSSRNKNRPWLAQKQDFVAKLLQWTTGFKGVPNKLCVVPTWTTPWFTICLLVTDCSCFPSAWLPSYTTLVHFPCHTLTYTHHYILYSTHNKGISSISRLALKPNWISINPALASLLHRLPRNSGMRPQNTLYLHLCVCFVRPFGLRSSRRWHVCGMKWMRTSFCSVEG